MRISRRSDWRAATKRATVILTMQAKSHFGLGYFKNRGSYRAIRSFRSQKIRNPTESGRMQISMHGRSQTRAVCSRCMTKPMYYSLLFMKTMPARKHILTKNLYSLYRRTPAKLKLITRQYNTPHRPQRIPHGSDYLKL